MNTSRKRIFAMASIFFVTLILSVSFNSHVLAAPTTTFNLNGTDTKNAQSLIVTYVSMFGGVLIAFGLVMTALKMILCNGKEKDREEAMQSLGKIILGAIILGGCLLFAGFLLNITNKMGADASNNFADIASKYTDTTSEGKGTFVIRAVADLIAAIPTAIFSWFGSLAGFLPLDQLIFNVKNTTPFNISGAITIAPFTDAEWHNLNYIYLCICSICSPFILLMVAATGFSLILSSTTPTKRAQLQEDLARWFFSAVIVATGPILIKGLFLFFNYMTASLYSMISAQIPSESFAFSDKLMANIKTGSVLTTAIVKFMFAWKYLEINLIFLSRKVIIVVMYAFTPIAALLWGINNRVQASQIWLGEMITNASMQFFYAFTFSVMILSLGSASWKNWLYSLIWMFALIKIAEVLRNSLQGFFTRLAGIDETSLGKDAVSSVGSMFAGAASALNSSLSGGGNLKSNISNGFNMGDLRKKAFGDALTSGGPNSNKNLNLGLDGGGEKPDDGSPTGDPSGNGPDPSGGGEGPDSSGGGDGNTINPKDFKGLPPKQPSVDKDGNVNLKNLKENSQRKLMYDSMLNDNLQKNLGNNPLNSAGNLLGGMAKVATGFNPALKGIPQGISEGFNGLGNRRALGKAINTTVSQIQDMNGGNMSKEAALQELFGGNTKLQRRFKEVSFRKAVLSGNGNRAGQILGNANPINKDLTPKQKTAVIAKTSSYTSVDGFRWGK